MGHLPSRESASGSDRECAGDLQPPTVSAAVGVDGAVVAAAKHERAAITSSICGCVSVLDRSQSRAWPDVGATVVVSMPTLVDFVAHTLATNEDSPWGQPGLELFEPPGQEPPLGGRGGQCERAPLRRAGFIIVAETPQQLPA
jgi:hypothetical protein